MNKKELFMLYWAFGGCVGLQVAELLRVFGL